MFRQTKEERKGKYRMLRELGILPCWRRVMRDWRMNKLNRFIQANGHLIGKEN